MSNCTNNFIKRVIGVTRTFQWTITTNGAAVPLVADDLTLHLVPPRGEAVSLPFDVDDNVVSFTWQGDDQHIIGCYSLILWANYGEDNQRRVDIHNFLELIPWSDRQSGEYSDLVEETIDLETADFGENIMVVDNLNSTSATDALSANMGRQLNVTKQDVIADLATIRSGAAAGAAVKEWAKNDPLITDDATQVSASKLAFNGNLFEQWVPGIASSIGLKGIAGFLKLADISQWDSAYNDRMLPTVAAVKAKLQAVLTALGTIEAVIPSQASSTNKLTDKDYVDGAIATNTANFVGTFDTLAELQAVQNPTKNDYGFVIESDAQGNEYYDRYKYTGTQWLFEYKVESTPFTAEQWAAIQSGITAALVSKLSALPTNAELNTALAGKQPVIDDLTTIRSGAAAGATAYQKPSSGIPKTDLASGVQASLDKADSAYQKPSGGIPATDLAAAVQTSLGKADAALSSSDMATINGSRIDQGGNVTIIAAEGQTITIDAAPTEGSNNAVSSGGVYRQLNNVYNEFNKLPLFTSFNGSSSIATCTNIVLVDEGDELEIELFPGTNTGNSVYALGLYSNQYNTRLSATQTKIYARANDDTWIASGVSIGGTKEHYVLKVAYEDGKMNFYVDGALVHSYNGQKRLTINRFGNYNAAYWSGKIGFVKINGVQYRTLSSVPGWSGTDIQTNTANGFLTVQQAAKLSTLYPTNVISATSSVVTVYTKIVGDIYAKLTINHEVNTESGQYNYKDLWRIASDGGVYQYDGNEFTSLNKKLLIGAENEFAINFQGMGDFTGGYHGYERIDTDPSCYVVFIVDGQEFDITSLVSLGTITAETFAYRQKSFCYTGFNYTTPGVHFANHVKRTEFVNGGYTTRNYFQVDFSSLSVTTLKAITAFTGLVAVNEACAEKVIGDDGVIYTATHPTATTELVANIDKTSRRVKMMNGAFTCELDSKVVGASISAYKDAPIRVQISDRADDCKYYSYLPSNTDWNDGDVVETECEVRWMLNQINT